MNWRRNGPPATVDQLRDNLAAGESELAAMVAEVQEIEEEGPALMGDPVRFADAQARRAELEALIPGKRRTVDMIRNAIPATESRERRDRIRVDRSALEARTAKLKRGLPERYNRAAEAFAAVLGEMEANAEEWRLMNGMAATAGDPAGEDAERELRKALPINSGGWSRIWADLDVPNWEGRLLFEGRPNRQRTA